MFGKATITLGIGPHSCFSYVLEKAEFCHGGSERPPSTP